MVSDWGLVAAPTEEPLTLDEAKQHCAISQDDDNALLVAYLQAAREAAEQALNRSLLTQTRRLRLSDFVDVIGLPMASPLQSVSSIAYYDEDGALQTLSTAAYVVDTTTEPGRVSLAPNQSWPAVQCGRDLPITVTYVAGWTSAEQVPELVKQGMRFFLASLEMDRLGGTAEAVAARTAAMHTWQMAGPVPWLDLGLCHA